MRFENTRIDWYRSPIDREQLRKLMARSDLKGWVQSVSHIGLFLLTGSAAFIVFSYLDASNWGWALPLLLASLFVHGTVGSFMGLVPVHELQHRTVFNTQALNAFFEKVYAFVSWSDYVWYQQSHPLHHFATCHKNHDGEVPLPITLGSSGIGFWLALFAWNPFATLRKIRLVCMHARGEVRGDWYNHVLPDEKPRIRTQHRNWARFLLVGHGILALIFLFSGHWFLIFVFNLGAHYCGWLAFLCGLAQHFGMQSDVSDFRYNTRTFTAGRLVSFLYWNMQYHVEHHMYTAVPFYNLPQLREALRDDLPLAPHGVIQTFRELSKIHHAARRDPHYQFVPAMPERAGS